MRRFLKIVAGIILFLIVIIVSVPFLVPVEVLKNKAIAEIEAMTGRKVSMGKVTLSVFPNIALSANDVSIGNPAWVQGTGNMAEVKTLRIGVELMPLIHKDIHVTDLKLESPVIRLVKNGNKANWQFAPVKAAAASTATSEAPESTPKKQLAAPLRLDSLKIENGSLSFEDSANGTKQNFTDVNLVLSSKDLPKSLGLKVAALANGTKVKLDVNVSTPLDLAIGAPSEVDLKADYGAISASWKGTLALKAGIPSITGAVTIPELDTTAFASKGEAAKGTDTKAAAAPAERWSTAPISMEGLSAANADIVVAIEKLVLTQMTVNNVKAHVKLQGGALQAAVDELKMFSGTTKLDITANHSGALGIKAQVKDIKTEELLTTLANSKVLTGTLNGQVDLNAHGNSQRALVSSLDGSGGFQMKDGTFRGGNLLNMTKNIATSFQGGQSKGETTDFSSLAGTFTAKNGVLFNTDLAMEGPLLRLAGKGQVDLPEWQVHYLLTPLLVTNRGSDTAAASGISVPVQVEGSLDSPSYHPDLRGALEQNLKDPAKLKENLKDIKKNLNKDTLKNLLGR